MFMNWIFLICWDVSWYCLILCWLVVMLLIRWCWLLGLVVVLVVSCVVRFLACGFLSCCCLSRMNIIFIWFIVICSSGRLVFCLVLNWFCCWVMFVILIVLVRFVVFGNCVWFIMLWFISMCCWLSIIWLRVWLIMFLGFIVWCG